MSYLNLSLSIPYWLPTSGMVAAYLIAGLITMLWIGLHKDGWFFRKRIIRGTIREGLGITFGVMLLWPMTFYFYLKSVVRKWSR